MAPLPSDAGTEGAMGAHSTYPLLLAPTFFSPSGIAAKVGEHRNFKNIYHSLVNKAVSC